MKYIVLKEDGVEYMILFANSPKFSHKRMAEAVKGIRVDIGFGGNWEKSFIESEVVSAGFVYDDGTCYGRSETLNIDSRPADDTELLEKQGWN